MPSGRSGGYPSYGSMNEYMGMPGVKKGLGNIARKPSYKGIEVPEGHIPLDAHSGWTMDSDYNVYDENGNLLGGHRGTLTPEQQYEKSKYYYDAYNNEQEIAKEFYKNFWDHVPETGGYVPDSTYKSYYDYLTDYFENTGEYAAPSTGGYMNPQINEHPEILAMLSGLSAGEGGAPYEGQPPQDLSGLYLAYDEWLQAGNVIDDETPVVLIHDETIPQDVYDAWAEKNGEYIGDWNWDYGWASGGITKELLQDLFGINADWMA